MSRTAPPRRACAAKAGQRTHRSVSSKKNPIPNPNPNPHNPNPHNPNPINPNPIDPTNPINPINPIIPITTTRTINPLNPINPINPIKGGNSPYLTLGARNERTKERANTCSPYLRT